jgi:hypothetical protein
MANPTLQEARAVKPRVRALFAEHGEVLGVGITRMGDAYGVKVNLRAAPVSGVRLPESIDGVPIKMEVVGTVRKLKKRSPPSESGA